MVPVEPLKGTAPGVRDGLLLLTIVSLAHFGTHFYQGAMSLFFIPLREYFDLSLAQVGLLMLARQIAGSASSFPSGLLGDFGRHKRLLLALSLLLISVTFVLIGKTSRYLLVIVAFVLFGIGHGIYHPQAMSLLTEGLANRRGFALGVHGTAGNLGESVAPFMLGFILAVASWRSVAVAIAFPGVILALSYYLSDRRWSSPKGDDTGPGWEGLATAVFSRPLYLVLVIASFIRTLSNFVLISFLPVFLGGVGLPIYQAGLIMGFLMFFGSFSQPVVGALSDRVGRRPFLVTAFFSSGVLIALLPLTGGIFHLILPVAALLGLIFFSLRPVMIAAVSDVVPQEYRATAIGFVFTVNAGVSAVGLFLLGLAGDSLGASVIFIVPGVLTVLAGLVIAFFYRTSFQISAG